MKKIIIIIFFVFGVLYTIWYAQMAIAHWTFTVKSPVEICVDLNNNLIFDEKVVTKINNISYIEPNKDYSNSPVLKLLIDDEKFYLNYRVYEFSNSLIKNNFVQLKDDELYVNNKKYSELLLNSNYAFDDTIASQKKLVDFVKSINLDEYVLLNKKNNKYHKLSCESGRKSNNFSIIKKVQLDGKASPCKQCFLNNIVKKKQIRKNKETKSKVKEVFDNGKIKIVFLDLNNIFKPDFTCSSVACKILKKEIDSSKSTIDFAIYGINNQPEIFNALVNAYKRGVQIRWVTDYSKKENYYPDTEKLKELLPTFNTDKKQDKSSYGAIMHNKFFIFDNKKVWTGSANITSTDLTGFNANYVVLIDSSEIANQYLNEFNQMYDGNFHTDKQKFSQIKVNLTNSTNVEVLFSPQDSVIETKLLPLINSAKNYIYIPIFFFTSKEMSDALINAHLRGVDIKIINDATNAHTKYSVHKILRKSGIKVKTENYAGKMHMKSIIIDDKISVLGSMNYTKSANLRNDENILIIYNSEIAKYLKGTFMYLWNKIPDKYLRFDPRAESLESIGSCFDGIDNDFDGKIDSEDEGCNIKQK